MHKPINAKLARYTKADKERLQKELIYLKMEQPKLCQQKTQVQRSRHQTGVP